ncbi:kinase-like protein [Mytilinidion resinicola]|uniref:Kinase-like protein n=1 Tax=Mytilinidion resinicola TaxID=574789 RepID=A0A6A6YLS6_9PEZI|nr:kinase-like protein [Mytilinidion resinicola]KAF2809499.1 kinase-like protein [Mytilinidion resinicola]
MSELRRSIEALLSQVDGDSDEREFIPRQALFELLTPENVRKEIDNVPAISFYHKDKVVDWVVTKGRKVFAILVLLKNEQRWLLSFIEHDQFAQMDERLPFPLTFLQSTVPDIAKEFYNRQWEFVSPVLSRNVMHRSFPSRIRLPFIKNKLFDKGGFGDVYEIELHPDHQTKFKVQHAHSETTEERAPGEWDDYNKELRNLSILNELGHPNVIELLASYTHGDKHNLIFPFAEDGNLHSFLLADRPTSFASDEAFLDAFCGLASAIERVHYYALEKLQIEMIGCHHDLKPKNILVQGKSFLLSDFGLSKLKEATDDSKSPYEHGAGDYLAPECETHTVSRPSDIWSFGCIILEILTYIQGNSKAVKDFRDARKEKLGNQVRRAFHAGIDKPKAIVLDSLTKLAEFDSTSQILVELTKSMLDMDPKARPDAKHVASRLRFIFVQRLISSIHERYQKLSAKFPNSFEAHVEARRQRSWTASFESMVDENDCWSYQLDQEANLSAIIRELVAARDELASILTRSENALSPLYADLSLANDRLLNTLPVDLQMLAKSQWELSMLESDDTNELERTQRSLEDAHFEGNMSIMAKLKRMSILAAESVGTSTSNLALDAKFVSRAEKFGDHTVATVRSEGGVEKRVLIEWVRYPKWETKSITILSDRIEALASALSSSAHPQEFRTLSCSGFIHDISKPAYGLVYDMPVYAGVIPQNLAKVINDTAQTTPRPTLESRFDLAYTLALALSSFHKIGWLHKSISAYNVLCFNSHDSSPSRWLESPFLVGFNHSRQKDPLAFTVGPTTNITAKKYHHPQYLNTDGPQAKYRLEFDHYSLGLVLLEIGLWKTLERLTNGMKVTTHEDRLDQICESRVRLLGHQMGTAYQDAVLACLRGVSESELGKDMDDEGGEAERNTTLQLAFVKRVLEPLRIMISRV